MRTTFASILVLLLAACSPAPAPPAPDPSTTQSDSPYAPNPAFGDVNTATPVTGQWFYRGDEGVLSAGFGVPESEFQFVVSCTQANGQVTIMSDHELVPDQPTTLTLITERVSIDMPANSFNEGLAHVAAELPQSGQAGAVAAALSANQTRIGINVGGDLRVYPWSEDIARAMAACV